jgi:hypothetical protein
MDRVSSTSVHPGQSWGLPSVSLPRNGRDYVQYLKENRCPYGEKGRFWHRDCVLWTEIKDVIHMPSIWRTTRVVGGKDIPSVTSWDFTSLMFDYLAVLIGFWLCVDRCFQWCVEKCR